jgi:hypothetical protein
MTASSGQARFDHNPVTKESKGLLIEEARTNQMTYSIPYTGWTHNVPAFPEYGIAPDGTQTAVYFTQSQGTSIQQLIQRTAPSFVIGNDYTYSVYAKSVTGQYIAFHKSGEGQVKFDLLNGTTSGNSFANSTAGIEDVGNGWYRCYVSFEAQSTLSICYVAIAQDIGVHTGAGEAYGVLLWGAQVEEGNFATSYIATSGSQVTRVREDANFDFSESGLSNGEGTMYAEFTVEHDLENSYPRILQGEGWIWAVAASSGEVYLQDNATGQSGGTGAGGIPSTGTYKAIAAYENYVGFYVAVGGTLFEAESSGKAISPISGQSVYIGQGNSTSRYLSGYFKKLSFYPEKLPNDTLVAMTEA